MRPISEAIYALSANSSRENMLQSGLMSEELVGQIQDRNTKLGKPSSWRFEFSTHTFFAMPSYGFMTVTRKGRSYQETLCFRRPPMADAIFTDREAAAFESLPRN